MALKAIAQEQLNQVPPVVNTTNQTVLPNMGEIQNISYYPLTNITEIVQNIFSAKPRVIGLGELHSETNYNYEYYLKILPVLKSLGYTNLVLEGLPYDLDKVVPQEAKKLNEEGSISPNETPILYNYILHLKDMTVNNLIFKAHNLGFQIYGGGEPLSYVLNNEVHDSLEAQFMNKKGLLSMTERLLKEGKEVVIISGAVHALISAKNMGLPPGGEDILERYEFYGQQILKESGGTSNGYMNLVYVNPNNAVTPIGEAAVKYYQNGKIGVGTSLDGVSHMIIGNFLPETLPTVHLKVPFSDQSVSMEEGDGVITFQHNHIRYVINTYDKTFEIFSAEKLYRADGVDLDLNVPGINEGLELFEKSIENPGIPEEYKKIARKVLEEYRKTHSNKKEMPPTHKPTSTRGGTNSNGKTDHLGGIDLNPSQMSMQIKKQGEDFKFYFNGTQIDAAQVTGATFTIRTMTPVVNLPLELGLNMGPVDKPKQEILGQSAY